ncbi:MAG: hypothetical protein WC668_01255 [Patescibacteria group bacterium]|jgi:hypothetical protein
MKNKIFFLIFAVFLVVLASPAWAYVMSSTNYELQRDSLNFIGGLSTSTTYDLEQTGGEIATGLSTSTTYKTNAGFQQLDETVYVTLTVADSSVSLSPSINSLSGGTADGSAIATVRTNGALGYTLQIKAGSAPALVSGANSFADYVKAGANPDYAWSVAAADSGFGFTPEGSDIISTYKDDGATCNTGGILDNTDTCWDELTTSDKIIAQSSSADVSGIATTIKLRAEAGVSASQSAGSYSATVTLTAYTN